jgi:hypothetical protein
MSWPNRNSVAESIVKRDTISYETSSQVRWLIVNSSTYLEVNRISSIEPSLDLPDGIVSVAIKNVEVGNALFIEEGPSYTAMEPDIRASASGSAC